MTYVDHLIEWLEMKAGQARSVSLTPAQCRDIAQRLRAELPVDPPPTGYCGKPATHAPGCDCAGLMSDEGDF